LAPARLDQPGATAQVVDKSEVFHDLELPRGKLDSCTVEESLRSELVKSRHVIPDTLLAIISFGNQSVQLFFSPEHALEDFRRKVEELWNIPEKMFYLLVNGKHESRIGVDFPPRSLVRVCIKGLLGGEKKGMLTVELEGEYCRCWTSQTFREVIEDRDLEIKADLLFDAETGIEFGVDEIIGDHYDPDDSPILDWVLDEEVELDHTVKLHYCLRGQWRTLETDGNTLLEDFMAQFHRDESWFNFCSQGEDLDPRSTLECYCDDSRFLELEINLREDVDLTEWEDRNDERRFQEE
jgi:hypothetical protein